MYVCVCVCMCMCTVKSTGRRHFLLDCLKFNIISLEPCMFYVRDLSSAFSLI